MHHNSACVLELNPGNELISPLSYRFLNIMCVKLLEIKLLALCREGVTLSCSYSYRLLWVLQPVQEPMVAGVRRPAFSPLRSPLTDKCHFFNSWIALLLDKAYM